jgi:hypothetical protein
MWVGTQDAMAPLNLAPPDVQNAHTAMRILKEVWVIDRIITELSAVNLYNVIKHTNNFHQQHPHKTEKFENNLQFRNNFLVNLHGSAPILQTPGVIYAIQWDFRHCDPVIGGCS